MRLAIRSVARPVDATDFSDLTKARQLGPAVWELNEATGEPELDIPFDRALTEAEAAAIMLRLSTRDSEEEKARATLQAYLPLTNPTAAQTRDALRALARLLLSYPA